jgi:predicted nucleic acid-binding Zn ribbon protein
MFLVAEDIRVGMVTGHMPLKEVAQHVTPEQHQDQKLDIDAQIPHRMISALAKPRVAVLGTKPTCRRGRTYWEMKKINIITTSDSRIQRQRVTWSSGPILQMASLA